MDVVVDVDVVVDLDGDGDGDDCAREPGILSVSIGDGRCSLRIVAVADHVNVNVNDHVNDEAGR